jgi:hypothetical protein
MVEAKRPSRLFARLRNPALTKTLPRLRRIQTLRDRK